jgi:hypothetical protein
MISLPKIQDKRQSINSAVGTNPPASRQSLVREKTGHKPRCFAPCGS